MSLRRAWHDSWRECMALTSKNGRLLSSALIKKLKTVSTLMIIQWWFIIAALLLLSMSRSALLLTGSGGLIGFSVFYFILYLALRPSVALKSYRYYLSYTPYYFGYAALLILLIASTQTVSNYLRSVPGIYPLTYAARLIGVVANYHVTQGLCVIFQYGFLYAAFTAFFTFFWLDSALRINSFVGSLWRALKMVVYNYPFLALLSLVCGIISSALDYSAQVIPCFAVRAFVHLLFAPVPLTFFSLIYSKKVHEQFDLYFPVTLTE